MTKKISMGKRIIACACSVVMAGAFVPAVSMAADGGAAAEDTVLKVVATQVDENGNPTGYTKTTNYTASQLQAKVAKDTTYNYLYSGKGGVTKVSSNSVVTFSSLLSDVSGNFTTATASVKAADGAGKYTFTYEDISTSKSYFPNYENNSESKINTDGAIDVPAGIALSAKKGAVATDAIASDVECDEDAVTPMSVLGSAKDGSALAAGMCFWTGIQEVDFTYQSGAALTIYEQNATEPGDPEVVRSFSSLELEALASANQEHNYYQYSGKNGATKIETEAGTYVTFSQLFAGLSCWNSTSTFSVGAGTDMNTKYTYQYTDVASNGYYFPNYVGGESSIDKAGAADVPAALALSYKKGTIANGEMSSSVECTDATGNVVVLGAAADATQLLAGNRFWTNVDTIIITYTSKNKSANTLKVSPTTKSFKLAKVKKAKQTFNIKASDAQGKVSYSVTKAVKKAGVSVSAKGKVTIKKGTKKGTYKVTVTAAGNDEYKAATKTVKVKVVK